jgi:hypothetical protein
VLAVLVSWMMCGARSQAAEGLFLRWNECALAPTAASTATFACANDQGAEQLVASFTLEQPVDDVIAVEVVVDVQFASPTVPPWWQFDQFGCREDNLTAVSVPPLKPACQDFWNQFLSPGVLYQVGGPRGNPSQSRIVVSFALPSTTPPRRLEAGPMYYAATLVIQNLHTPACGGCLTNACLVLNSIRLGRVPGSPGEDPMLVQPGPQNGNFATWQGGAASCSAVPARSSSSGRLKSLYR